MTYTIEIKQYRPTDSRLGRHVSHDSRNRQYAYPEPTLSDLLMDREDGDGFISQGFSLFNSVRHHTSIPVSNQGNIGGCTGWAEADLLGYDQYFSALPQTSQTLLRNDPNAMGLKFYTLATQLDNIPGAMPGQDTGSDGPSAAKAAMQLGWISGYKHAFSASALMAALQKGPVMVGTDWYNSMFQPDADGLVTVSTSSGLAGGHEYVADEYDVTLDRIGFLNSWGDSFGVGGRFYVPRLSFNKLLAAQGDVTVPVPLSAPAPTPTPVPPEPAPVDADVEAAYRSLKAYMQRNGAA